MALCCDSSLIAASSFSCLFLIIFFNTIFQLREDSCGMKQKRNKPRYNAQFKTFNSEQSCIDVFSRVESLFLQKFYRYNLSDYFQDAFINVEEDIFIKKIKNKQLRQLASETFLTKTPIRVEELVERMNNFYNMEHSQIPQSFKYLYGNAPFEIGQKQLVIVQVKMRAEIEKVENLPTYFYKELEQCQLQMGNMQEREEEELIKHLSKYEKKVLNLFIVYFGDINFTLFRRHNYTPRTITFFNNQLEVKIYVFYISRLALIDKFKKINKIQHLEYVNDLLIQLYEFKRDKARSKRLKNRKNNESRRLEGKKGGWLNWVQTYNILKWIGFISITGVSLAALYLRFFF